MFDQESLLGRLKGNRKAAGRAMRAFLEDAPSRITRIQTGLAMGDAAIPGREFHTIKGASATLGGEALQVKAAELERLLRDNGLEAATANLPAFLGEYERFRSALKASGLTEGG